MTRNITYVDLTCTVSEVNLTGTDDLLGYLLSVGQEGDILLAHTISGVIWGVVEDGQLFLSHDVAPDISPALQLETLEELRLFSPEREIYLWHEQRTWYARTITSSQGDSVPVIVEKHILWGTRGLGLDNGFTLLENGAQGLRHVVPIDATQIDGERLRVCLAVQHVLEEDPRTGLNVIAYSRLAGLKVVDYGE